MSQAYKPVEFEVNFVDWDGPKLIVSGRNYERDIFLGDIFCWVYRITSETRGEHDYSHVYSDERPVSLRVGAIEYARRTIDKFGHQLDVLGHGSTGRLTLLGEGIEKLKPADSKPFSCDLLRIEKLVKTLRPYGLAEGQLQVPDDFDDPLPENILRDFEK